MNKQKLMIALAVIIVSNQLYAPIGSTSSHRPLTPPGETTVTTAQAAQQFNAGDLLKGALDQLESQGITPSTVTSGTAYNVGKQLVTNKGIATLPASNASRNLGRLGKKSK